MSTRRMPAIFLGHGNPMNAIEPSRYSMAWQALGGRLPRPQAILSVSAHWLTRGSAVTAMAKPQTIHDFGGFPQALYQVQYPAPGDPALAARVAELLAPLPVAMNQDWGLDHGTWSVLVHLFPQADIPVVQLSLDASQPPRYHYELAGKLAPLRDEGVLILGSGDVVHNLRAIRFMDAAPPYDWALRFDAAVQQAVLAGDHETLIEYARLGEDARLSVPTNEHYLPLLYVLAQQQATDTASLPVTGIDLGSISMLSVLIGGDGLH
jgi:4,5-DOPA dioxygenase extradiol